MAAEFSQDAVLFFLQSGGGSVRNADLLLHFSSFLRDHAERDRNRELFKKFVNSVATVKQSDGVSYVVLRKKFRGRVHGDGGTDKSTGRLKVQPREEAGPARPAQTVTKTILPAAGFVTNSAQQQVKDTAAPTDRPSSAAQVEGSTQQGKVTSPAAPTALPQSTKERRDSSPLHGKTAAPPAAPQQRVPTQVVPQTLKKNLQDPPLQNLSKPSQHNPSQVSPRRIRHRQSYKTAVSYDDDDDEEQGDVTNQPGHADQEWPLSTPHTDSGRTTCASSSSISESPALPSVSSTSERILPMIYIQDVEGETPGSSLGGPGWGVESQTGERGHLIDSRQEPGSVPWGVETTRHSLPPSHHGSPAVPSQWSEQSPDMRPEAWTGSHQSRQSWLSSSPNSVLSSSPDAGLCSSERPLQESLGARWSNSMEDVQARAGKCDKQQLEARSTDHLHGTEDCRARVMPWHLSTGDLYDDYNEGESSEGSTSSPQPRQRSAMAKRLNSQLRNRMCRSLGADLDQLYQDDRPGGTEDGGRAGGNEAARLIRLHRISSSLSLHYNLSSSSLSSCSTPPHCQSLGDLTEKEGNKSLPTPTSCSNEDEGPIRQSLVPLEPREHAWLVKGAAGAWPDIYSLFREDSSLLNRQDFISGFTVLHWIAKHGDHRVLNTLWYGVEKAGMNFNVDARSTSGQTALHVAAIHGNKNIMRLLVTKFKANVRLRDIAGKRPWQYLSRTAPLDMFQLLGAPARAAVTGEGAGRADSSWEVQQRRRRRHHLSSASSAERPLKLAGATKVKRSSSIAAFLKHKSLHRFYGHHADSPL